MSEPKVHTADSAHIDNSELFPAEDGDVSGFFCWWNLSKDSFLKKKVYQQCSRGCKGREVFACFGCDEEGYGFAVPV